MKVLVINGSVRKEKGYTAKVLGPFIKGMEKAGGQVELLYSKKLDVNPCNGEFDCWYKNLGKCYINDSMQQVYPKLREADILVLGIPVYLPIPSEMQKFLNRLMPLMNPILEFRDGRTSIRFHDDVRIRKIGSVLRPHGYLLSKKSVKVDEVIKAIREAGFSLIKEGSLPEDLLRVISQPLISEKELRESQSL